MLTLLNTVDFTFIGLVHENTLQSSRNIYVSLIIMIPNNSINIRLHLGFEVSLTNLTQVRKYQTKKD